MICANCMRIGCLACHGCGTVPGKSFMKLFHFDGYGCTTIVRAESNEQAIEIIWKDFGCKDSREAISSKVSELSQGGEAGIVLQYTN